VRDEKKEREGWCFIIIGLGSWDAMGDGRNKGIDRVMRMRERWRECTVCKTQSAGDRAAFRHRMGDPSVNSELKGATTMNGREREERGPSSSWRREEGGDGGYAAIRYSG